MTDDNTYDGYCPDCGRPWWSESEMMEFDPRGFVMALYARRDFMLEVRKIVGVTTTELGWMSEVLQTQEQQLGRPWWEFTHEEIEMVLLQLRASAN